MNYRHAFHAGNHADVLKHVLLTRVLSHLAQKDKPFAVLDAHAGIGRYDLSGVEAFKTGEWKEGIGKLLQHSAPGDVATLLKPYRDCISALNEDGKLRIYPGSPQLISAALRASDRMILNELHPADANTLASFHLGDAQVKITRVDASQAVKAALPFRERRGLVLIDPAYETADEAERVVQMVGQALKRMATAVLMVWYPIISEKDADVVRDKLGQGAAPNILCCELRVREAFKEGGLAGSGLVVFSPPHTLYDEAKIILPWLAQALGKGKWGRGEVRWLKPPR